MKRVNPYGILAPISHRKRQYSAENTLEKEIEDNTKRKLTDLKGLYYGDNKHYN